MDPVEVIDLLSSPPPAPSTSSPSLPTTTALPSTHLATRAGAASNLEPPLRSSPRRRAAAAALARFESSRGQVDTESTAPPRRNLLDDFQDNERNDTEPVGSSLGDLAFGRETLKHSPRTNKLDQSNSNALLRSSQSLPSPKKISKSTSTTTTRHAATEGFVDLSSDLPQYDEIALPTNQTMAGTGRDIGSNHTFSDEIDMSIFDAKPPATKVQAEKTVSGFVFLSDDFDSTVNLDESFAINASSKVIASDGVIGGSATGTTSKGLKRAVSEISTLAAKPRNSSGLKRSQTSVLDVDPIQFTSSPDLYMLSRSRPSGNGAVFELSDEKDVEAIQPFAKRTKSTSMPMDSFDTSSDAELPDIDMIASQPTTTTRVDSMKALDKYKATKVKGAEKARKDEQKAIKTAARDAEKERKRLEKEARAREKQAASEVAKVNTLKTDKKTSTPEMIVDLPSSMDKKLVNQITTFFAPLGVELNHLNSTRGAKDVIQWRRKIEARYNEDLGHWEPVPRHVAVEKHVLCIMHAKDFVELSMADEGHDLDAHVLSLKVAFKGCVIIYLIEGMVQWQRKNKNIKNRQFVEAVRQQIDDGQEASAVRSKRKKAKQPEYVDDDMIEDALLRLQVVNGVLVHHTGGLVETAQWVITFTQHISTIPYRQQRMALDTAFCMESGQVKTGENAEDTFVKMLQEIHRITPSIAYGIAAEYPSITKLMKAYELSGQQGRDLLMGLKKCSNRDGAFTDKDIGKAISRRVWSIFTSREEGSTNV